MSTPPPPGPTTPTPPPGPKAAEVLYPVREVALLWSCSDDHIYDLIAAGHLRTVQLGVGRAKTRVPASALAEFIERRTTPARRRAA